MKSAGLFKKLILLLMLVSFVLPAYATQIPDDPLTNDIPPENTPSEVTPINITVPVTVKMESALAGAPLPGEDTFPVTITPLTEGAPGPHSTMIVCSSTASADLIFGSYTEPGEYSYQITVGKSALTNWIEDDKEETFTLTVTVSEGEDGTLTATSSLSEMSVVKTYLPPLTIDVVVKWPDGGERPVTVRLYETRGESKAEIGKVTVTKNSGWKANFKVDATTGARLRPNGIYTVEEMDLYKFSERYDYNKKEYDHWIVTITNKEALPQTGQLNKPIPFLFLLGALCTVSGACLLKKRRIYE